MFAYIWPIALVVISNVVYQICAKSVPEKLDPLVERLYELAVSEKEDEIRRLLNGIIPDAQLLDN